MRKFAVTFAAAFALVLPEVASAWTFSVSGTARCEPSSGQYVVVWTIDNSKEREAFTFNGGVAPAHGSATVTETYPGTATGASKTITGGWPSDKGPHSQTASVSMAGNCVTSPPPPVDQCPNIDGVQQTLPPGMVKDANGNCVTPPAPPAPMSDDCPNLDGVQGSVPEGMIKDGNGDCVPRPTTTTTTAPAPAPLVQSAPASPPAQPAAAPVVPAQPAATPPVTSGVKAEVKTKSKQRAAKQVKKAKKVKAKKAKSKRARGAVLPITK